VTRTDLWPRLEPLLARVERPSRYLGGEWGSHHDASAEYRAALIYPDTYEIGQANQGLAILYSILNGLDSVAAERAFLPWLDLSELMRERGVPLFTLESCMPVAECDLVGITVPYELSYSNVLEVLDLAGIPLRSDARGETDPLVIGGGPCVFNPEPFAAFFDAILIGEGEEAVVEIVAAHRASKAAGHSRARALDALSRIPGVYVPTIHTPASESETSHAPRVSRRVVRSLSAVAPPTCPIVPFMDVVHDRFAIEILRGCTRGCRFCQAGMVYRPVRERTADEIVRDSLAGLACTGYDEVSLTSLSSADHSQLEEVLRRLKRRLEGTGTSISLPSLRVDAFSVDMARMIAGSGRKSGLTFAPEAGTQRLRDVINKNVTEEDLLEVVRRSFEAGWRRVKLYFMLGLPTETDEDIVGIGRLVAKVHHVAREATPPAQRGGLKIGVSVSTFVPKANTPFQWDAQLTFDEIKRRQAILRESVPRKGVDLHWHDADVSFLEGVMARGGRELADVVETAWRDGAVFDAWTDKFSFPTWMGAFEKCGIDPSTVANRQRSVDDALPWDHIDSGVARSYLIRERERALGGMVTKDCSFSGCTGCDLCDELGVETVVAGERR
jgi:radical SAM family uncharacterized protein